MNVSAKIDVIIADETPANTPLADNQRDAADAADAADAVEIASAASDHNHKPVQKRDGKEPWCKTCGLTADGREPSAKLAFNEPAGE